MPHATLVDCDTLAGHLQDPAWVVFDCRHDLARPDAGQAAWRVGHVPGARFLHLDHDLAAPPTGRNGRHPLPAPEDFARTLRRHGVNAASQVIAYDDAGGMFAARLWWMLRWLGHEAVAVLDGGWKDWLARGLPVSDAAPSPQPGDFIARPRPATALDCAGVLAGLRDPRLLILDARAEDRYRGENETLDPVGGHIPGAWNRFFRHNLDAQGRFKPAAELRREFTGLLGEHPPSAVVHQCGSGVTACHNLLAMEIAALPGSRLFPGSWSEWCADPARPVARGPQRGAPG